ncbi:carbohydrate-binding domain-containing protein, partial [Larkinella sp. C7]|uniref:carbohydrate-binding domain-containing protein n=1 Tax=Larkinella sp. C7 TaxID=2576607 RepID=UPI001E4CEB5B
MTLDKVTMTISAGDDGIQVDDDTDVNSGDLIITDSGITITSTDKGITVSDSATVDGETNLTITAGDEGIEGRSINLNSGTITIDAGDDGLNATEWTTKDDADLSNLTNTTADIENT